VVLKIISFICTYALCLITTHPALAQNISNPQKAEHLQKSFQTLLERKKQEIETNKKRPRTLSLEGPVSVEPADSYYAITLPPMRMDYSDGKHLEIGMIAMNASAHDKPYQYKITMALPTPILGFDQAGNEIMRIHIGAQKMAGIWHENLQTFVKLDALYQNIQIDFHKTQTTTKIPRLHIVYDLDEDANARWSGPMQLNAQNITLNAVNTNTAFSLNQLNLKTELDQISGKILANNGTSLKGVELADTANGIKTKIELSNLKLSKQQPSTPEENLSVGSAHFELSFDDALNNAPDAQLNIAFKNLNTGETNTEIAQLLPQSGQFTITHHNIPLEPLAHALTPKDEETTPKLNPFMLFKIPAILAQAGSYLEISDSAIENKDYRVELEALARADITATNSATIEGKLTFAGLEKILSMAQVTGTRLHTSSHTTPIRTLARILERLKALGQVEADNEKGFKHIFNFKMDQNGQMLINDQNALTLFQEPKPPAQSGNPI